MNERELRAFVGVVDARWMGKAAVQLGYSTPAIRYQIRCLEKDLGVTLFERDATRVQLTRNGTLALPWARAALSLLDGIRETAGGPAEQVEETAEAC